MSQHFLWTRKEDEVLWFQRRSFLQGAAAWTCAGGFGAAVAQQRSNIVELQGDALINGQRLRPDQTIQTGDSIETGPKSHLIFVIGNSSFHVRQNSRITAERGGSLFTVAVLRMLTGAVASVWGKGGLRQIITPTLTAGIRGTGIYTEIFTERHRSYLCNCYGTIALTSGQDKIEYTSDYHIAYWADPRGTGDGALTPAKAINHTDEELEFLARLVNQKTAWQIAGKKGHKDSGEY